jgi:hypothetical protein
VLGVSLPVARLQLWEIKDDNVFHLSHAFGPGKVALILNRRRYPPPSSKSERHHPAGSTAAAPAGALFPGKGQGLFLLKNLRLLAGQFPGHTHGISPAWPL